jgi:hypothetical protein
VVFGNDSLYQFNAATGFWKSGSALAHKVSSVAAGAHGEVLITSGPDQRLGQVNPATGAVTDWGDPWVTSLSLGVDGALDVVFANGNLYQHVLGTSSWPELISNGQMAVV